MNRTSSASADLPAASVPEPVGRRGFPLVLLLVAIVVIAALFLVGWVPRLLQQKSLAAITEQTALSAPRVRVAKPRVAPPSTVLALPGSVVAERETGIYARTGGFVRSWKVDLGDRVAKGELLAEIDAPEVIQELAQAKAALGQAQAGVEQAKAALTLTELNLKRFKSLGPDVATQQDIDTRQADRDGAAANLGAAEAKTAADRASVGRLEELVSFTRVTAPFAGTITQRSIELGNLVTAGSGTAQALFRLAQTDPVRVLVDVPQASAQAIAVGFAAKVRPRGRDEAFAGEVKHIARALDQQSRTMRVEIEVPNADARLLPGMYVQTTMSVPAGRPLLLVSADALMQSGQGTQLAVVGAGDKVRLADVVIAVDYGADVAISEGLSADDRVVLNPAGRLVEGLAVEVIPAADAPAAPPKP